MCTHCNVFQRLGWEPKVGRGKINVDHQIILGLTLLASKATDVREIKSVSKWAVILKQGKFCQLKLKNSLRNELSVVRKCILKT